METAMILFFLNPEVKQIVTEASSPMTGMSFVEIEQRIQRVFMLGADILTAILLQRWLENECFMETTTKLIRSAPRPMKSSGRRDVPITLLGGSKFTFKIRYLVEDLQNRRGRRRGVGRRREAGGGVYPQLLFLGIRDRLSPALRSEVARQCVALASFEEARTNLIHRGVNLDLKTLRRITKRFAQDSITARNLRFQLHETGHLESTSELTGRTVVVAVDGGRVRLCVPGKRGRRNARTGRRKYKCPWREPKLLTIYTVGDDGKKDQDFKPICDGTLGDSDALCSLVGNYLKVLGAADAKQIVFIGDGARWI